MKKQRGGFVGMLLGTLGASLMANVLAGKGSTRTSNGVVWDGDGVFGSKQDF